IFVSDYSLRSDCGTAYHCLFLRAVRKREKIRRRPYVALVDRPCGARRQRVCVVRRQLEQNQSHDGVLRVGRSIVISPPRSRSRNTRRLISRLTPSIFRRPLGSGKLSLLVFQWTCSSSMQTKVAGDRVCLAAAAIHHSGTLTNGSTFL